MAVTDPAHPVLIAGGGIGGLATAMGLAQKGIPSVALEKAQTLGEVGAGIQIGRYASQRFLRTARVQLQSLAIGEHIYHPSSAHALVRDSIMSTETSEDYYEGLAWLYSGTRLSCEQPAAEKHVGEPRCASR